MSDIKRIENKANLAFTLSGDAGPSDPATGPIRWSVSKPQAEKLAWPSFLSVAPTTMMSSASRSPQLSRAPSLPAAHTIRPPQFLMRVALCRTELELTPL